MRFGVHAALRIAQARFHPELVGSLRPGSAFDHPRPLLAVAEPDAFPHAVGSQRGHDPHGSKKGSQSPCRTGQFARSGTAVDATRTTIKRDLARVVTASACRCCWCNCSKILGATDVGLGCFARLRTSWICCTEAAKAAWG